LITWDRHLQPRFSYYGSRYAALAAAPRTGERFSVVDLLAKADPTITFPSITELVRRTRLNEHVAWRDG
jgi:hypothetical protein